MSLSLLFFRGNTQLFLRNTTANGLSRGGTALFDLLTTQGNSPDTAVVNTTIAGTEIQFTKTAGGTPVAFITPRFGAAYTITGIDIANWFLESMVLVNVGARYRFYRYRAGVETEFTGSPSDDGVEFTTIAELYTWAASITALDFLEDDRLLIVPYVVNVGVMAMGTATLRFNGGIGGTPAATSISENTGATYTGLAATYNIENNPTSNQNTNVTFEVYSYAAGDVGHAFVHATGLSNLSAGTITNARLRLKISVIDGVGANQTISVYRSLRNVVQNQVTWNAYSTGNNWTTPGGLGASDTDLTELGNVVIPFNATGYVEITGAGLNGYLTNIINGVTPNYPLLVARNPDNAHDLRFVIFHSDNAVNGDRLELLFDYAAASQADSYLNIYPDITFKAEGSGITGSAASSQAQTSAASGTYTPPNITGTATNSQAQTTVATGTYTPEAITGTQTSSQAQSSSASGTYTAAGITGTATQSQAQTTASSGTYTPAPITGTATGSQAQTSSATGSYTASGISGDATNSQAQTSTATGTVTPPAITGAATNSQAQTSNLVGTVSVAITGTASSGQAQSTSASSGNNSVGSINKRKQRYVVEKDGEYLFFNSKRAALNALQQASATLEVATVEAKVSASTENTPQVFAAPVLHDINAMLQAFNDNAQAQALLRQKDYAAFIQSYENWLDEEAIELLLLAGV